MKMLKIKKNGWRSLLLAAGILAVSLIVPDTLAQGSSPKQNRCENKEVHETSAISEETADDGSGNEKTPGNRPLIQAHAGASAIAPENTLAAFQAAKDIGADGIETDIRMTKDGCLVLCHGDLVDDISSGHGAISEMTLAELKELDFGSWFDEKYAGEQISTLEECLKAAEEFDFKIVCLELKPVLENRSEFVRTAADTIIHSGFAGRVIVCSFDDRLLKEMKEYAPEIKTGILTVPNLSAISMFHLADYLPKDKPLSEYTKEDVKRLPAIIAKAFAGFGAHGNSPEEIYLDLVRGVAAVVPDEAVWEDVEKLITEQADLISFIDSLDFPVDYLHCHYNTLSETLVEAMHERGIGVNVWTPDKEGDIRRVLELHPYGIITNEPALAMKLEQ